MSKNPSPAMQLLHRNLEHMLTNASDAQLKEHSQKYGEQARRALSMLEPFVNHDASMSDDQAVGIVGLIYDDWMTRPNPPRVTERIALATYLNSCKA